MAWQTLINFSPTWENDTYADIVLAQYQEAVDSGKNSTPTFVINQVSYPARNFGLSYQGLDLFIKLMQLRNNWYNQPEQVIDPEKEYIATIETQKGNVVIELYADTAPG